MKVPRLSHRVGAICGYPVLALLLIFALAALGPQKAYAHAACVTSFQTINTPQGQDCCVYWRCDDGNAGQDCGPCLYAKNGGGPIPCRPESKKLVAFNPEFLLQRHPIFSGNSTLRMLLPNSVFGSSHLAVKAHRRRGGGE